MLLNIETAINYVAMGGNLAKVQLGDVTLSGLEVPDSLRVGGEQTLIVHKLPGGDRIIDSGGNDPDRLQMSARFMGPDALLRAQQIERLRIDGKALIFKAFNQTWQVKIRSYWYEYSQKGAVIPYSLELEVYSQQAHDPAEDLKALSDLVGGGISGALSQIMGTISDVSKYAQSAEQQVQDVVGEVTPIANLVGLGGPLAQAQNYLTEAQGVTQTGVALGQLPATLGATVGNLETTGKNLLNLADAAGQNIEGITSFNATSIGTLLQNMALEIGAREAGQQTIVAAKNAQAASGQ